jgi:DNA-directed RNA polymerase specialized sigma24 family protein
VSAVAASAVKAALTPNRRRRLVENDEFAAFVRRVVAAHGRRVSTGDVEALADLVALSDHIDAAMGQAVCGLRRFGYSWAEIAARLGVTRQAAHQRWGRGEP